MPNRADLAGVKRRKAPHALLASGSRWAATSGCEGRYGAVQAVKEHDCRSICAGPLTRRSSPVVTILNSPQFHAGSVGADLARRSHLGLGPRWVRVTTIAHGHHWSPTVANGSEKPEVVGPLAHATAMMQAGDSDCGPEGRERSSASPGMRVGTDEVPDRPVYSDDRGGTKAPPKDRCERSRDAW